VNGKAIPLVLLLGSFLARAQEIEIAGGPNARIRAVSLFDEIQDAKERTAFRELWQTLEPAKQKAQASAFIAKYPHSVLLKEAYEIAARASVALGDDAGGLEWARLSLRLMPENPFLQVMVADVAARHGQYERATRAAREALNDLAPAEAPAAIAPGSWPGIRDELRETADFALGRAAGAAGRNREAERWLLEALRLRPDDYEAIYALGLIRLNTRDDDGAASCFAEVMKQSPGPLADAAAGQLRHIYERESQGAQTFEAFATSKIWRVPAPPTHAESRAASLGRYAGSAACRDCHANQYERWRQTGMAKMFRSYQPDFVIGDFSGVPLLERKARAVREGDQRYIEIRDGDTGKWARYRVDAVIGSKWQQAYATKLASGDLLVLPVQYSRVRAEWVNYWRIVDGENSPRADLDHFHGLPYGASYQRDCAPCHTSQLRYTDGEKVSFLEGGVDCEMCHGPSLAHVKSMHGGVTTEPRLAATEPPVDFGKLSPEQSVAICAQCHMQSAIHEPQSGGAVNYAESGGLFYRQFGTHLLSDFTRKAFYGDGRFRATTFIGEALVRSRCFREGGATCASCHDPHPENPSSNPKSLKYGDDSDQMCLQCHASKGVDVERHTLHAAATEASRCVSCHMPRNMDALLFRVRSHQIDEIPDAAMTVRFGESASPNACLDCHRDRDTRWLGTALAGWQNQAARFDTPRRF
jgi:predicted CXXCH cytochrome family protein